MFSAYRDIFRAPGTKGFAAACFVARLPIAMAPIGIVTMMAQSGTGYWLAGAADEIFANPSSIVGSIGVVSGGFGFPALLAKLGVERRLYVQGENKGMLDPFSPERQSDIEHLHGIQKVVHESFKSLVRERRGPKLRGDEPSLFSGAFWTGCSGIWNSPRSNAPRSSRSSRRPGAKLASFKRRPGSRFTSWSNPRICSSRAF